MGQVHINPLQFDNLEKAAQKAADKIKSYEQTSPTTGVIVTSDVTIDYTYDPLRQVLFFNIGAKHSLAARIAGDNIIDNHITALIFNLEGLNAPVEIVQDEPILEPVDDSQQETKTEPIEPVTT